MADEEQIVDDPQEETQDPQDDTQTETGTTDTQDADADAGSDDDQFNPDDIEPEVRSKEEEDAAEDDEEIDPDDEKQISKVMAKQFKQAGFKPEDISRLKDEAEVNTFLSTAPEYNKYKPAMLKYMSHPAYKNVPTSAIAAIVASKDMQKIGAAKERAASQKVAQTKNPGTVTRPTESGSTDWATASKEEFDAKYQEIMHRR